MKMRIDVVAFDDDPEKTPITAYLSMGEEFTPAGDTILHTHHIVINNDEQEEVARAIEIMAKSWSLFEIFLGNLLLESWKAGIEYTKKNQ